MTIKEILTNGLLEGYTKGNASDVTRGNFKGKRSTVVTNEGTYHDEWFATTHSGGGQELVKTPEGSYTRLYGGGTPKPEELTKLGITIKDVKKRWGKGQEDIYPVTQFEKLWGDMTALPELDHRFVVVPRNRGQQLKEVAQLDGWLQDGSAAYIESICEWK